MNEEKVRDLLRKSIIETSDDFTDKLMHRLEAEKVAKKAFVWMFKPTFSILVLAMLMISFTSYNYLNLETNLFDIGRTSIFTIGTLLLFLALNYILKLNETYSHLKNKA